jgi:hypothetical protein
MDEGMLTIKEDLPVAAVSGYLRGAASPGVGGSGPKQGTVHIEDLQCRGDGKCREITASLGLGAICKFGIWTRR